MSVLHDSALIKRGADLIFPFYAEFVQPASIDLHLGDDIMIMNSLPGVIDPSEDSSVYFDKIYLGKDHTYLLKPNEFIIGSTYETVNIPSDLVARFEGKSSLGRLGLMTHVTAGFIDPGFFGNITVEIKNLTSKCWVIKPGMKIGQICFETLREQVVVPYGRSQVGSHYQGSTGVIPSQIHVNFKLHPHFERNEQDVEA